MQVKHWIRSSREVTQFRLVYDSTLYSSYFTLGLPHKTQNCLVQSLLMCTTWKRIWYCLHSAVFMQDSLHRETRELVLSHTTCCAERQEGNHVGGGGNNIPAFSKKFAPITYKSYYWGNPNTRKRKSTASTCEGLVGIPVLWLFTHIFNRASPMFCLRLDVTFHPLTCQDNNSSSHR